jgi:hypothetical protein
MGKKQKIGKGFPKRATNARKKAKHKESWLRSQKRKQKNKEANTK